MSACRHQTPTIELLPFKPKALCLSFFGIGNHALRENALRLIRGTELNALVIDVKGDRGMIAYRSTVPLARQVGAQAVITVPNIKELVASLHGSGIYLIARIVTFKDDRLASAGPDWAVRRPNGRVWRDREHLAWGDPFRPEVLEITPLIGETSKRPKSGNRSVRPKSSEVMDGCSGTHTTFTRVKQ